VELIGNGLRMMNKNWIRFHDLYDTWSPLQSRLRIVREHVASAITAAPAGPVRILSLCAGDGRDLLGVLIDHPRCAKVHACLVENSAELVARGDAMLRQLDLPATVRFLHADATRADTYLAIAPADIVIAAGVFGNLSHESARRLVRSLRSLCNTEGTVIWTHKTRDRADEYTVALLLQFFRDNGFRQQTLANTDPPGFLVAAHVYLEQQALLVPGIDLFDFPG
jgi:hypothetical protein